MAPPSKLGVATSSLQRLVKEEASYHKELEQQQARIKKYESNTEEENAEFLLKQERQALEETKNVLPTVREKITQAIKRLEEELESNKEAGGDASGTDVTKAEEAIAAGNKSLREAS